LFYVVKRLAAFRGGAHDATGNGGYSGRSCRAGIRRGAHPPDHAQRWLVHRQHAALQSALRRQDDHDAGRHRCARRLARREEIKSVPKVPEDARTTGADGKQRHGDAAIACVLATYAVEMIDAGEIAFHSQCRSTRAASTMWAQGETTDDELHVPEPQAW
jgi:phage FluMu gp28-like protein